MQVTKGTWRMREQCVPGSLSSSPVREPGKEARSAVAVRALISAVFVPWASFTPTLCSGSSPSRAGQWTVHIYRMHKTTFRLHEYLKQLIKKFTIHGRKQTYIHTTSAMQSR